MHPILYVLSLIAVSFVSLMGGADPVEAAEDGCAASPPAICEAEDQH